MSYRWTINEIREMVKEINELSLKLGTGKVSLQEGTQLYGRAWRLYELVNHGGLNRHTHFNNYLGDTKTEAGNTLRKIRYHLEDLVEEKESQCCRTCGQEIKA